MKKTIESNKIIAIFLIFCSVACMFGIINGIADFNKSKTTYDDLEYKEFVFVSYEIDRNSEVGDTFYISVEEQDKTLYVSNALTSQKRDDFDALKPGDKLFCYVDPDGAKNRIVEIKSEKMIISLQEYQDIHRKNGVGMSVVMSVLSVSSIVVAIVLLKSYKVKRV